MATTERKITVSADAQLITVSCNRAWRQFQDYLEVPEAVQLIDDLRKAVDEAIRKGRDKQSDAEYAARCLCRG